MYELIDSVRSKIAQITEQIACIASSGSQPRNLRSWSFGLADELCKRYCLPRETIRERFERVVGPLGLPDYKLQELRGLILERCALSLEMAKLKARQISRLPNDRRAVAEFIRRREIEEGLIARVSRKIGSEALERRVAIMGLLELIFDISRELQVLHLMGGDDNEDLREEERGRRQN